MSALEAQIVKKGTLPPGECIFTGEWDDLIDTGRDLDHVAPRGYIAVSYVRQLARDLLGMVDGEDLAGAQEAIQHLSEIIEEQQKELDAYHTIEEARKVIA